MAKDPSKNTLDQDQAAQPLEGWQRAEAWIMDNRNILFGILGVAVLAVGGLIGYKQLYLQPREAQAQARLYEAQAYFSMDSIELALRGDGTSMGFQQIIQLYGATPTGKLAQGYAAMCHLRLGEHEQAIRAGKKYRSDNAWLDSRVYGVIGHAHSEQGDLEEAVKWYDKAAEASDSEITAPHNLFLAGMASMEVGKFDQARRYFQRIKDDYPLSQQGRTIDKYIVLAREQG